LKSYANQFKIWLIVELGEDLSGLKSSSFYRLKNDVFEYILEEQSRRYFKWVIYFSKNQCWSLSGI